MGRAITSIIALAILVIGTILGWSGIAIDRGTPAEDVDRITRSIEVLQDLNQNGVPDWSAAELPDFAGDPDSCDAANWQPGDPYFTELCRGMVPDSLIVAGRSPAAPSSFRPDGSAKTLYEMDEEYERQTE